MTQHNFIPSPLVDFSLFFQNRAQMSLLFHAHHMPQPFRDPIYYIDKLEHLITFGGTKGA
jgi:hypothetical protein